MFKKNAEERKKPTTLRNIIYELIFELKIVTFFIFYKW